VPDGDAEEVVLVVEVDLEVLVVDLEVVVEVVIVLEDEAYIHAVGGQYPRLHVNAQRPMYVESSPGSGTPGVFRTGGEGTPVAL
jgi:hypothetical protein